MNNNTNLIDSASCEYSSLDELKADFNHIVDSEFFKGPMDYKEALSESEQFLEQTHPILIFKLDEQFVILYP